MKDGLVATLNKCPAVHSNRNWTDQVREFEGEFRKFRKTVGLHQYNSFSGTRAAFAERAIRALKAQLVRYLEEEWMWRYIDKLPDFVETLNECVISQLVWHRQKSGKSLCSILSHLNKGLQ